MIRLCKQKGLNAQIGDLENLPFDDNSFDGIWACASLLHMPKSNLPKVLNISRAKSTDVLSDLLKDELVVKKGKNLVLP